MAQHCEHGAKCSVPLCPECLGTGTRHDDQLLVVLASTSLPPHIAYSVQHESQKSRLPGCPHPADVDGGAGVVAAPPGAAGMQAARRVLDGRPVGRHPRPRAGCRRRPCSRQRHMNTRTHWDTSLHDGYSLTQYGVPLAVAAAFTRAKLHQAEGKPTRLLPCAICLADPPAGAGGRSISATSSRRATTSLALGRCSGLKRRHVWMMAATSCGRIAAQAAQKSTVCAATPAHMSGIVTQASACTAAEGPPARP